MSACFHQLCVSNLPQSPIHSPSSLHWQQIGSHSPNCFEDGGCFDADALTSSTARQFKPSKIVVGDWLDNLRITVPARTSLVESNPLARRQALWHARNQQPTFHCKICSRIESLVGPDAAFFGANNTFSTSEILEQPRLMTRKSLSIDVQC